MTCAKACNSVYAHPCPSICDKNTGNWMIFCWHLVHLFLLLGTKLLCAKCYRSKMRVVVAVSLSLTNVCIFSGSRFPLPNWCCSWGQIYPGHLVSRKPSYFDQGGFADFYSSWMQTSWCCWFSGTTFVNRDTSQWLNSVQIDLSLADSKKAPAMEIRPEKAIPICPHAKHRNDCRGMIFLFCSHLRECERSTGTVLKTTMKRSIFVFLLKTMRLIQ